MASGIAGFRGIKNITGTWTQPRPQLYPAPHADLTPDLLLTGSEPITNQENFIFKNHAKLLWLSGPDRVMGPSLNQVLWPTKHSDFIDQDGQERSTSPLLMTGERMILRKAGAWTRLNTTNQPTTTWQQFLWDFTPEGRGPATQHQDV